MTAKPAPICRDARRELIATLLEPHRRGGLPARVAEHVASCPECAGHRDRLLAATRLSPPDGGYHQRLRARTLAKVASNQEHPSPGLWLWLAPVAIVSLLAGYGIPACVLSSVFGSVLGSPGLGLAAALLVVGSLFVLLPAGLAVPLILRTPHTNGSPLLEEKGVLS